MRKWIACRTAALKRWRKSKSKALWIDDGVEEEMPDTLLMLEQCLVNLAKRGEEFDEKGRLSDFLCQWPDLAEFVDEIFAFLQQSSSHGKDSPIKARRKAILKAARASKKAKFIDDPIVAEAAQITALKISGLLRIIK